MVVAPAGTTATWLNAGLTTSPSGCKRVISISSTVARSPDRSDQLRRCGFKLAPEPGCPRTVGCMRFEATIDVAASAQLIFEVYTDVERWPEWTDSVTSAERLDQGPLSVGSRAGIKQPRLPATVWEVTDVVAGHSFTWMARGPGIITTAARFSDEKVDQSLPPDGAPGSESSLRGVKRSKTGVTVRGRLVLTVIHVPRPERPAHDQVRDSRNAANAG